MKFSDLSKEQQQRWRDSVKKLGINPDNAGNKAARLKFIPDLEAFRKLVNTPIHEKQRNPPITSSDLQSISNKRLLEVVRAHVNGSSVITDPKVIDEINKRFEGGFFIKAYTNQDVDVTSDNPLILNGESSFAMGQYGSVSIYPGGYIQLLGSCHFECQQLTKVSGSGTPSDYDFYVLVEDGTPGQNGMTGGQGNDGAPGVDGVVTCGGDPSKWTYSTAGGTGQRGSDGAPGTNGGEGNDGVEVGIVIHNLSSAITILQQGGSGGAGGNGGNGGAGGNGGRGGNGNTCGFSTVDPSPGGQGGSGGNGGNGGNGGDGGSGGNLTVLADSPQNVSVKNGNAPGGQGGNGGNGGSGGSGGQAGNSGSYSSSGSSGISGSPGTNGQAGEAGTSMIYKLSS